MRDTKQFQSFGFIVGGMFALMGIWPALWRGQPPRLWSLILGGLLMGLALVWPSSLAQVYRLWMRVGEILGWLNTRIILSVLFYALFTPIGVCMRLRGKDPMRSTLAPEVESYRVVRQPRSSAHMMHQF